MSEIKPGLYICGKNSNIFVSVYTEPKTPEDFQKIVDSTIEAEKACQQWSSYKSLLWPFCGSCSIPGLRTEAQVGKREALKKS